MRLSLTVVAAFLAVNPLAAQPPRAPSADTLVERMGAYLESYSAQLIAMTADERYEQREVLLLEEHVMGARAERPVPRPYRRLEADVAFVRLPGSDEWAGFRDVYRVDGKTVKERDTPLVQLLSRGSSEWVQATAMTAASSRYNLGAPRTTNMPTVPLDLLHPRHRPRFAYELKGTEPIRGVKTSRLGFTEKGSPTVIRRSGGHGDVRTHGTVWIESNGTVWRVEMFLEELTQDRKRPWSEARMRVDFDRDRRLDVLVPVEMTEIFGVHGGRGEGRATYSNFKRFETGARIVP